MFADRPATLRVCDKNPVSHHHNNTSNYNNNDLHHNYSHQLQTQQFQQFSTSYYSPMSPPPQPLRAASPASPRPRQRSKQVPAFHLSLPRFHPAIYQSQHPEQPPSPQQARSAQQFRPSNSRDALRQYRELMASMTLPPRSGSALMTRPSKPRLHPMGSPGPVTPLALEESEDNYFTAGARHSAENSQDNNTINSAGAGGSVGVSASAGGSSSKGERLASKEALERLLQRENERLAAFNASRKDGKPR